MGLEKIVEYKKKLGLTTEELSARSGVPIGTLNKILSGATKDPKLETLKAIARVLGLTLNDFEDDGYYTNIETAAIAQEIATNEELRLLYDDIRDAKPEDVKTVHEMLLVLKRKERNED